jgi:hypothetical protein
LPRREAPVTVIGKSLDQGKTQVNELVLILVVIGKARHSARHIGISVSAEGLLAEALLLGIRLDSRTDEKGRGDQNDTLQR